ncbi:pyridoxal-phosphate dependent enzyme [Thermogymnomonas acidicola]|nr:pyridoxal-phosphate dependent enzyme [Thermogymnomonas acidicola]
MEEIHEEEEPPGKTPFFRAFNLEKALRLKRIFVKFEGASITGTQKDRISRLHVSRAKELGYNAVAVASCGNYGASISYFAREAGIGSVVAVPESYTGHRVPEMERMGSQVLRMPGKYEDLVERMKELSAQEGWYDSNPGSVNSWLDFAGYANIAYEIVQQLGHAPYCIAVPVGNGTTLAGIHHGFVQLYKRGEIERIPRFIGSSTPGGNPIVDSWSRGFRTVQDLDPSTIRETGINEPLVSYHSYDGQKALDAIYSTRGAAVYVSDLDMIRFSKYMERFEGIPVLPASASSLAAIYNLFGSSRRERDLVVVITGRGGRWTVQ